MVAEGYTVASAKAEIKELLIKLSMLYVNLDQTRYELEEKINAILDKLSPPEIL